MTDCICKLNEDGSRQKVDGQTIHAHNCPTHGVPKPVKRQATCHWEHMTAGIITACGHTIVEPPDDIEAVRWCLYCGGELN